MPTITDWQQCFDGAVKSQMPTIVAYQGSMEIARAGVFVGSFAGIGAYMANEHKMKTLTPCIETNTGLMAVEIGYDAARTLHAFSRQPNISLHKTERNKGLGQATSSNVGAYQQKGVYPYNQPNYQTF